MFYQNSMEFDWKLIKRSIRFWWQRRTRGFDDSETWALDHYVGKFILPRLKRFKEVNCAYPGGKITEEMWNKMLDDMIYAMEISAIGDWAAPEVVDWKRVNRGHKLFGQHFRNLWW